MSEIRTIRIFLAILFLVASIAYLFIGDYVNPMAAVSQRVQIIPSALAMTVGATGFWLVATFVFGRVYCSTVCPVGTLQDSATWLRRRLARVSALRNLRSLHTGRRIFGPFSYRRSRPVRGLVLVAYIVCLLLGLTGIAAIIEPWNMMRAAARLTNHAGAAEWKWLLFAGNVVVGGLFGLLVLIIIWFWALLSGRRFCTEVCPIGTMLGYLSGVSIYHIEIDPDRCVNCMKCEDVCKSQCIKVVSRYVDNTNCVRCFDCLKVCGNDAIRFQRNRNRRLMPMLRRRART